jgi:hypothetical protein
MVQLTRRNVILAKIESTYGTDPTPTTAANAIEVQDLTLKPVKGPIERPAQHETLQRKPSLLGEEYYEINFKVEVTGTGAAGTAPRLSPLLQACDLEETISAGVSVKYRDADEDQGSAFIYAYWGGRLHKIGGVKGSVKGMFEAGKIAMLEFNLQGTKAAAPAITAMPTDAVYDDASGTVQICKNGTFSYNSKTTLCASLFDFDLQNVISLSRCLSSSNVVERFTVTDRNPIASINPETQIQTSYDFYGDALTNQRELSYAVGSVFTVTIPKFNPFSPEFEDVDGILHDKINGQISESTGYSIELEWVG